MRKMEQERNADPATVEGFGEEWSAFSHENFPDTERRELFERYFRIFPWDKLPPGAVGADIGCGSGRWAVLVAPRTGRLHLVDASRKALEVARKNLSAHRNVAFHEASVDGLPFEACSLDFAYSLGVLHHVPRTEEAVAAVARALKPGAPFLLYLYYSLDNRPAHYRAAWRMSDLLRRAIARLPFPFRLGLCNLLAAVVYFPLARAARILHAIGRLPDSFPLAFYKDSSFYVMRTDALDRFGTRLERRFSREEIRGMLEAAGIEDVVFSESPPYWVAVGARKR